MLVVFLGVTVWNSHTTLTQALNLTCRPWDSHRTYYTLSIMCIQSIQIILQHTRPNCCSHGPVGDPPHCEDALHSLQASVIHNTHAHTPQYESSLQISTAAFSQLHKTSTMPLTTKQHASLKRSSARDEARRERGGPQSWICRSASALCFFTQ